MLARDAVLHGFLEFRQQLHAQRLGKLVVDRDRARRFDRLDGDREGRVLAGEMRGAIIVGELDVEGLALAGLQPSEVVLEAGNELAGAHDERHVLAGAAFERRALERTFKIDGDAVAVGGAFGLGDERTILIGDRLQRLIDLFVGHLGSEPGELDALEIGERDRGNDLHLDRIREVGLAFDDSLNRALVRRQHNLRLDRKLDSRVGDDLRIGLAHGSFDHLGHGGFAVQALEVRDRNLAGPEAAQLHAALEVVEPLVDLRLEIGCRDDHAIFALKTR